MNRWRSIGIRLKLSKAIAEDAYTRSIKSVSPDGLGKESAIKTQLGLIKQTTGKDVKVEAVIDFTLLRQGEYLKIRSQRGLDEVYELLGRNLSGSYLHVVYRVLPDHRVRVFHINGMAEAQKRRYRRYRK